MQDDGNPIEDFRIPEGPGEKLELFGITAPFDPWDVLEQSRQEFKSRAGQQTLDEAEAEAGIIIEQMQNAEWLFAELLPYAEYEEAGRAMMKSSGIDPGSYSMKEDAANLYFTWARAKLRYTALEEADPLVTRKWGDTPHGTKYNADELYELRRRTWGEHRTEQRRDVRELMRDLQGAAEAARSDYGVLLAKTQADPSDTLTRHAAADAWLNLQRLNARLQAIEDLHKHMVEVGKPPSYAEWYFGRVPLPERKKNGQSGDEETRAYTNTQKEWMRAALKAHEKHGDMQNEAKWCRRVLREYRGRATTQQAVLNMFKTQLGWIRTNETADDFDTYYPRIIEKLEKMKADGLLDVEP